MEISDTRSGRRQYLVTYSQADEDKFPTRESFGKMIADSFNAGASKVKSEHWACCREPHESGGFHYHCSIKMSGNKKWLSVKKQIQENHKIVVNFSDSHDHYISAYRYLCKSDENVAHSQGHPNLKEIASPKTKKSIASNRAASRKRKSNPVSVSSGAPSVHKPKSKRRLSNTDIAEFIVQNEIRTYTQLFATAEKRKREGEKDLAEYLFQHSEKNLRELIVKAWFMKEAPVHAERETIVRITEVEKAAREECVPQCNKQWLDCALEVLELNRVDPLYFASSMRDALIHGRGKFRNIILVGPANCAKTFMLKPLKPIFREKLFENPANDKFGWVGADKASVIILQDFRWNKDSIPWKDLLLLLEGETVKLPAPKNLFSEDVIIDSNVAIFSTSKEQIAFKGPYNTTDAIENDMMRVRWNIIKFKHQFTEEAQKSVKPCARCFAELVLKN